MTNNGLVYIIINTDNKIMATFCNGCKRSIRSIASMVHVVSTVDHRDPTNQRNVVWQL